jgi:7-carboxy-7-deazaguanine synthase
VSARAALIEIFHSVQGEGRFVGESMAFLRVATCPIRCRYCDTPGSYRAGSTFRVEGAAPEPNPVTGVRAAELIEQVASGSPFHAAGQLLRVSVTGGEPLVYPEFIAELGTALEGRAVLHLETAALDADALGRVLPSLAHLSADYKLPGTLEAGDPRPDHVACLERAAEREDLTIDVKLVLVPGLADAVLEEALADLGPFAGRILLVLQPVTPRPGCADALPAEELGRWARAVGQRGFRYRVIPQTHKQLGVE